MLSMQTVRQNEYGGMTMLKTIVKVNIFFLLLIFCIAMIPIINTANAATVDTTKYHQVLVDRIGVIEVPNDLLSMFKIDNNNPSLYIQHSNKSGKIVFGCMDTTSLEILQLFSANPKWELGNLGAKVLLESDSNFPERRNFASSDMYGTKVLMTVGYKANLGHYVYYVPRHDRIVSMHLFSPDNEISYWEAIFSRMIVTFKLQNI